MMIFAIAAEAIARAGISYPRRRTPQEPHHAFHLQARPNYARDAHTVQCMRSKVNELELAARHFLKKLRSRQR